MLSFPIKKNLLEMYEQFKLSLPTTCSHTGTSVPTNAELCLGIVVLGTVKLTPFRITEKTNLWACQWGSFYTGLTEVGKPIPATVEPYHGMGSCTEQKEETKLSTARLRSLSLSLPPDCRWCHATPSLPPDTWPSVPPASVMHTGIQVFNCWAQGTPLRMSTHMYALGLYLAR